MAKKKDGGSELFLLIGILLFLPFMLVSLWAFASLKREYLARPSVQRVMDIRRLLPFVVSAGGAMVGAAVVAVPCFAHWNATSSLPALLGGIVVTGAALFGGYLVARHIAVLYLGVIADSTTGGLYFPHDMQSYGVMDYLSLRFVHDFCSVDGIPLAQIEKMTRGRRGKDLYIHGAFGSRGITMSGKQKRDECIAMIQSLAGKKSLLPSEIEF